MSRLSHSPGLQVGRMSLQPNYTKVSPEESSFAGKISKRGGIGTPQIITSHFSNDNSKIEEPVSETPDEQNKDKPPKVDLLKLNLPELLDAEDRKAYSMSGLSDRSNDIIETIVKTKSLLPSTPK